MSQKVVYLPRSKHITPPARQVFTVCPWLCQPTPVMRSPLRLKRHTRLVKQPAAHCAQVRDIAASCKEWVAAITHTPVHTNKLGKALFHVVCHCARYDRRPICVKILGVTQVAQDLQPALGIAPLHQLAHRLSKELSNI